MMREDLHPDIIFFYKNQGKVIYETHLYDKIVYKSFTSDEDTIGWIYYSGAAKYYFNRKIYSEEDMLRIIKLKAFI
jgi:hypothetical protein